MKKIDILDTTLRDGAQSEGLSFSLEDKLKIIERLSGFGVAYIEAGNPASNPKDIEVFKKAAALDLGQSRLVAFGATVRKGLSPREDENISALLDADTKTVSVFGKSHDRQVDYVLRATLAENIAMIRRTIEYLIRQGREVIFDAEHFFDGYKSNPEYALDTIRTAVEAGSNTIVLCDTNGGCFPDEIGNITAKIVEIFKDIGGNQTKDIGIHGHDDTGCAVANTIAAVNSGAVHVQGTFIGVGERCGNAALSTIIPNLQYKLGCSCISESNMKSLTETAQFIAQVSNVRLPRNMPYVGGAAFSHKGGMHVDAVIKNPESFEHIRPEKVGNERNLLLSEISGRGTLFAKIKEVVLKSDAKEAKIHCNVEVATGRPEFKNDSIVKTITDKVKELEAQGYQFEAANASFELLVLKELGRYEPYFDIAEYNIVSSLSGKSIATVKVNSAVGGNKSGSDCRCEITGDEGQGPVNAIDKALRKALEVFYPCLADMRLTDYKVMIINGGSTAATTRILMECTDGKSSWTTVGAGDNIISASMIALVDSIEYMLMVHDL